MNHLKKALYAVLLVMFAVVAFSSCDKNEGLLQSEVNHTTASSELSATRQGGMRSSSLPYFGSSVAGWTKVKSGNNVTLYKKGNNIYIADVDLTRARIGLLFGRSNISNGTLSQNAGSHNFQKNYVSGFAQNESSCFLAVNFGFFHFSKKNHTWDASTYPFKQGSFVDIGGSKVSSGDYTNNAMYTMVVRSGLGVRLDNYGASDWANFGNTYANETKAYVVRNNVGNNPNSTTTKRTILAFTTKSGSYYQRMYIFVSSQGMKEGGNSNENSAKRYIRDFIEAQQNLCVPIAFCPLDGGGSTQLYVPGSSEAITTTRKVINALIVKD